MFIPLGKGSRCENGGLFVLAPRRVNRTQNFSVLQCPPKAVSVCSVVKDPRRGWGGFLPQNTRKRPRGRHGKTQKERCDVPGAGCLLRGFRGYLNGFDAGLGRAVSTKPPPPPPTAYGRTRKNTKTRFAGHERRGAFSCLAAPAFVSFRGSPSGAVNRERENCAIIPPVCENGSWT